MAKAAVTASQFKNLTLRQIVAAAQTYGLEPHDSLVLGSARQADDNHGIAVNQPNWGTDYRGVYQADKLLDGYLCQETASMRAEAASYRRFARDAYGY